MSVVSTNTLNFQRIFHLSSGKWWFMDHTAFDEAMNMVGYVGHFWACWKFRLYHYQLLWHTMDCFAINAHISIRPAPVKFFKMQFNKYWADLKVVAISVMIELFMEFHLCSILRHCAEVAKQRIVPDGNNPCEMVDEHPVGHRGYPQRQRPRTSYYNEKH